MKFAYLVMAHDDEEQLNILLDLLDHSENDIYLHIDRKSKICKTTPRLKNAKLNLYRKYEVYWGDISQTKCQMYLLKEAIKEYHDYYHLISGHDMPIKSHEAIAEFFCKNKGKQFIHFESQNYCMKENCKYYHFLSSSIAKCHSQIIREKLSAIENKCIDVQRRKGITRKLYCGANWYSITHDLAEEFCRYRRRMIQKVRWTISSDEYILQTFYRTRAKGQYELYAETKEPCDYHGTAREIDWNRGGPYIWRENDYEYLMASDRMFARKFSQSIDERIINRIVDSVTETRNGYSI